MRIKIARDYYDDRDYIYQRSVVDFRPGVTILVGCNGSGKSTLLRQIKDYCTCKDIPHIEFDNYKDGGGQAMNRKGFYGDIDGLIMDICSSEGERINNNLGIYAGQIGNFVRQNENKGKPLVILMDAIDSGLSIDYVIELKELLFKTILEDCNSKGIEVYIIASANEYELARGENCFNVKTCQYKKIPNYSSYRKVIIDTRKYKNKRYKHGEFEFE